VQTREAGDQCRQHRFGPVAVLDPCGMHHDDQQQPQDIDDNVALAPPDALAPVIAAGPPFSVVFTV
jgi:hypothetical protein